MVSKRYYAACLFLIALMASCTRDPHEQGLTTQQEAVIHLTSLSRESTRAGGSDAEIDPQSVYVLVFDGDQNDSRLLDWTKARHKQNDEYTAALQKHSEACTAYILCNVPNETARLTSGWNTETTLQSIKKSLKTDDLPQTSGVITSMPPSHPMCGTYSLAKGISESTSIGTADQPVELTRATAKVVVVYTGSGSPFSLTKASLGSAPVRSFVFPEIHGTPGVEAIPTAHYGIDGNLSNMMVGINRDITTNTETLPLYAYESLKSDETFVIIQGEYNNVAGYYRINMVLPDNKTENLPLLRNYYYRIKITRVDKPGYATVDEAIANPPANGIEASIDIQDRDSHEIISNGVDYLGLSNSEFIIYGSYAINEFNDEGGSNSTAHYDLVNGYVATTLNYKSRTAGTVTCTECTTESGGTKTTGIEFRDTPDGMWDTPSGTPTWENIVHPLVLPEATDPVQKKVIIKIPHDLISGKIKIKIGDLEKEIAITRRDMIAFGGDTLDMGAGFSAAKLSFENTFMPSGYRRGIPSTQITDLGNVIYFASSRAGNGAKTLSLNPANPLYVQVRPIPGWPQAIYRFATQEFWAVSEFYLTRAANQSRTKVYLIREPFMDGVIDGTPLGSRFQNYGSAFWKNNQKGERIIMVNKSPTCYWIARVVYGQDFIQLNYLDDRTPDEIQAGDAENYSTDASWKTYLPHPFTDGSNISAPNFRIALTSYNTTGKPRYGLVALMYPSARGSSSGRGQVHLIFIRQGEDPVYIFKPTEQYEGATRRYAQAFSPYNLTVKYLGNHPGGANFTDHKSMGGPGVFTDYPTQQGYLYQWGNDIAIHPTNPEEKVAITGYTYDYTAPYKEVCPDGYTLAVTDESNIAFKHSLLNDVAADVSLREWKGLCADGYYDRYARGPSVFKVGDGPEQGNAGGVFYNINTLANVFIPETALRPNGVNPDNYSMTPSRIQFWGHVMTPSDSRKQGGVAAGTPNTYVIYQDRKGAYPVRCVKNDHNGGTVPVPGGGDYKPWN